MGNGAITKALIELEKYHDALDGDFYREMLYNDDAERPRTHHTVNHRVRALLSRSSVACPVWRTDCHLSTQQRQQTLSMHACGLFDVDGEYSCWARAYRSQAVH